MTEALVFFILAALAAAFMTPGARFFARGIGAIDKPGAPRKRHAHPTPLLGGIALAGGVAFVALLATIVSPTLPGHLPMPRLIGVAVGALILLIAGSIDDKRSLSPKAQFFWSAIAAFVATLGGMGLEKVTNPLGGTIPLVFHRTHVGSILGYELTFVIVADVLVFVWLLLMMHTTKLLDGLDGLATGVAMIGGVIIAALALTTRYLQPDVALLAAIFAGACAGFLVWNFHPAKIFLGNGGSLFIGYMLGVLAVVSGGKLATALLVFAVPIFDVVRVVVLRVRAGESPLKGDMRHVFFRLRERGFSHRGTVLFLWAISATLGVMTLVLQSVQKLIVLGAVVCVSAVLFMVLGRRQRTPLV